MKRNKQINKSRPTEWQTNPDNFQMAGASHVAYWNGDTMMTAQMTEDNARRLLAEGRAFIISHSHIGALDAEGYFI